MEPSEKTLLRYMGTIFVLLALVFIALYFGVYRPHIRDLHFLQDKPTQEVLSECSKRMQITFPASTHLVKIESFRWTSITIKLKIEIDTADLKPFLEKSPFAKADFRKYDPTSGTIDSSGWIDKTRHDYTTARASVAVGETNLSARLDIILDRAQPRKVVIYLFFLEQ
jgi:hypothetical protein